MLGNPLIANGPSIYSWTVMNLLPKDRSLWSRL
jgi:hypothetical protein